MARTKIEYVTDTWNPVTGCSPVSEGCQNCYAKRMSQRLKGRYGYPKDEPFRVTLHPDRLNQPLKWKKSKRVFVCSMGDFFHEEVGIIFQSSVYDVIRKCPQHIFLFLTKRPRNALEILKEGSLLENVWLGVTCENQQQADERIPVLLQIPAAVRFVSLEPLLGPVDLGRLWLGEERSVDCGGCSSSPVRGQPYCPGHDVGGIDWCIVGAETGPGARWMNPQWARDVLGQCRNAGVPFFIKKMSDGHPINEGLNVREYPVAGG